MPTATEPKTTHIQAEHLRPGMIRVWRGLHSNKIVQRAEINEVSELSQSHVTVRYALISTVSRINKAVEVEVLAEGFEF